ncbi:MAG TPA: hypothetical protein VMB21_10750 [Candidatus Limnocylindria bacterium]|nr:hypothetical protein [Candidatus Limnocylindria bacterium]
MNLKIKILCLLLLSSLLVARANVATFRMNCSSIRVSTSTTKQSGVTYTFGFTTADDDVNGEWYNSDGVIRYSTTALFDAPDLGGTLSGYLYIDLPESSDTDGNLVDDFFEVSRPVVATGTSGTMFFDNGEEVAQGFIDATWNRAAGSTTGTVQLRVNLLRDLFLPVMTFTHTFEIYQYEGKMTYAVHGANVDASVDLTRQGKAGKFTGPFPMGRRSHDVLERPETDWVGLNNEGYTVLASDALIDGELLLTRGTTGTNYYGSFYFLDGVPSTPFQNEYDLWNVQILDPNDADGNHIPDLTDGTEFVQPKGPMATLVFNGELLSLTVSAKSGQQVVVEQRSALDGADWEEVETRTLSSDSEEVSLPSATEDTHFYRVRTL